MSRADKVHKITGLPLGPYPVGVTTVQFDDPARQRGLQTEIWYPATDDVTPDTERTKFSDYLGAGTADDPAAVIHAADAPDAIGGYRDGISIAELDDPDRTTWLTDAVRDAPILPSPDGDKKWPLIVFSHGSGAYRASYSFWTECLASRGYVVAACDHPGSARFTVVDGKVITPGTPGARSGRLEMEHDRPLDVVTILDGFERLVAGNDKFAGLVDVDNTAVTGMSFGGFTTAQVLELQDPRVKAAVLMCPSSGAMPSRVNKSTPIMVMIGSEDTVLGDKRNDGNRQYVDGHSNGDAYLLEIRRGGHVSFTSCEMYDPDYGNGISATKPCKRLTNPNNTYMPLDIVKQHEMINTYGVAFLDRYLKDGDGAYLESNHFEEEAIFRKKM